MKLFVAGRPRREDPARVPDAAPKPDVSPRRIETEVHRARLVVELASVAYESTSNATIRPMPPARILFLAANPGSTSRLALDEEMREIQNRLRTSAADARIELRSEWALRAEELPAALMRHRPHIVHFSGHGSEEGELMLIGRQSEEIHPVSPETLRQLFASLGDDLCCVLLNACYSAKQAAALSEVIPCVIGMASAIPDTAATSFAAGFYEALAFGKSVQTAFELGRVQMVLAQQSQQAEAPKLLLRAGVDPAKLRLMSTAKARGRRRSVWGLIAIAALSVLALWGAAQIWLRYARKPTASATHTTEGHAPEGKTSAGTSPPAVEPKPKLDPPTVIEVGTSNEIDTDSKSRVRTGMSGGTSIPVPPPAGPTTIRIGSGNRIKTGAGSTVETGLYSPTPAGPSGTREQRNN